MRGARVILCFVIALGQVSFLIPSPHALAVAAPGLFVISEVQTTGTSGGLDVPTEEFVELTNISADTLQISGWKLTYINGGGTETTLAIFTGTIQPQGSVLVARDGYPLPIGVTADKYFSTSSSGLFGKTVGQVRLADVTNQTMDQVGWGTATVPAPWPKLSQIPPGYSAKRIVPGHGDFGKGIDYTWAAASQPVTPLGGAFASDVCPNLSGNQPAPPLGFDFDQEGDCQPDSCLNIDDLQISVPDGFDSDVAGNCYEHDECDNVAGIQTSVPEYMIQDGTGCSWAIPSLVLSEVLPNAIGTDTGNEFVEIYNPTNQTVDLSYFSVKVGLNSDKTYAFPIGSTIGPGEYRSFSDSLMKFALVNTSSRIVLTAIDSAAYGDSGAYDSPGDGESWALIDGLWQYTNRPTPGAPNLASLIEEPEVDQTDSGLAPCPTGKYRNPLTNRCRTIESDAAVLATCGPDQYRNPETGRCKKISTSSLAPCKDNQYRSEETNRCRTIVTASSAKPCKDNQYRSEETGRCRNMPANGMPDAAFAVQPIKETGMAFVGWWALGGVGLLAAGYGIWEWRRDINEIISKLLQR